MISLSLIHNQDEHIGDTCESKGLITGIDETGPVGDYSSAYNKVASCASLYPYEDDEETTIPKYCCYAKIKYKVEGEKYTRKGCYSVSSNRNIDEEITDLENSFGTALKNYFTQQGQSNVEIKDVEADIDCNSKFLKYSALLILIALL